LKGRAAIRNARQWQGVCALLDVVPFEEEDESPFVGLLQVEAV
jgi:hypothetical protein